MSAPPADRRSTTRDEPHPGPAEVLAALALFCTPGSLATIDREVDEAYRACLIEGDPGPLRRVLDHWWRVVRINRGELKLPVSGDARADTLARWQAAHPGQPLPR